MQAQKPQNYYDELWYNSFKRIHAFSRNKVTDVNPQIRIDHKLKKITIDHKIEKHDKKTKSKLVNKLNRKLKKIGTLRSKIISEEKNAFIKNFYLEKLNEEENEVNLNLTRVQSPKNFKRMKRYMEKIFPTPSEKVLQKFINEFIFFIKTIEKDYDHEYSKKVFVKILNEDFFDIQYTKPKYIDNWSFKIVKDDSLYKHLNFKQILQLIKVELKSLGIEKEVKIKVDNRTNFSVSTSNKRLNIPKNVSLTFKRAKEIITHEIHVHLMRSINGSRYKDENGFGYHLLEINSKNSLDIEEGLAIFHEQNLFYKSNPYDLAQLYNYYLRIIAVYMAKSHRPYFVYTKIKTLLELQIILFPNEKINIEKSAKLLIKRLYSDFPEARTNCFNPKISYYLIGNRKIWSLKQKGFQIKNLMIGKLSDKELFYFK